jgi:hypothetical protein
MYKNTTFRSYIKIILAIFERIKRKFFSRKFGKSHKNRTLIKMEENIKIISEGVAKDLILKYALENIEGHITSYDIQKNVFKDSSIDEIEFLFEKIKNTVDRVADVRISEHNCIIIATGITKIFLGNGGFTKTEKDNLELKRQETERILIEFEKSTIDLKLKKWQLKTFWWIFGFAIIGSGLSVYNFINNLLPSKNEEQQAQKIEQMESELSKLHILILTQKKDSSLIHSSSEKEK